MFGCTNTSIKKMPNLLSFKAEFLVLGEYRQDGMPAYA